MRRKLIAGNWKMNNDLDDSLALVEELKSLSGKFDKDADVLICPAFVNLYHVKQSLSGFDIKVGAQNMHFEEVGAFTGEISPAMLKNIGVDYVIIGHSERRQYFNEVDETVNKKLKAAHIHGIIPIVCVGETLKQRESGIEKETVKNQIIKGFENVDGSEAVKTVIAYEPIWAIGTGRTASSRQANEMAYFIRNCLSEIYSSDISDKVIIQYGGSVKADNAKEILTQSDIDGALIGGASLKAEEFYKIINYAK
ncbi:triose-phosphate isomerase [Sedimentibacter sp.]|uniref:triose-phosphate isomerase n=1 Tax=Sedimentibacter sp. TaxID=1960295 RepID=UPI0028AE1930|nr:triose-phosphate isomerase [Sedimentibacter sp.]